jgi:hypothetical protein
MAGKITVVTLLTDWSKGKVRYRRGMRLKIHRHTAKQLVKKRIAEYTELKPVEFKGVPRDSAGVQALPEKKSKKKKGK